MGPLWSSPTINRHFSILTNQIIPALEIIGLAGCCGWMVTILLGFVEDSSVKGKGIELFEPVAVIMFHQLVPSTSVVALRSPVLRLISCTLVILIPSDDSGNGIGCSSSGRDCVVVVGFRGTHIMFQWWIWIQSIVQISINDKLCFIVLVISLIVLLS